MLVTLFALGRGRVAEDRGPRLDDVHELAAGQRRPLRGRERAALADEEAFGTFYAKHLKSLALEGGLTALLEGGCCWPIDIVCG